MGCDIHCNLEVRHVGETVGTWWPQACDVLHFRWYALFEAMAGVRGDDRNAVVPPRGLPRDVCAWEGCPSGATLGDERHTPSWLSWQEFKLACSRVEGEGNLPIDVRGVLLLMDFYERNGYETRIVFNFDT